jgi:flagellar basal body rod protein FlgG
MSRGIYVALSGAVAQQATLDDTAHNLANGSSDGYQRTRVVFREVLAGVARNQNHFAVAGETVLDRAQGALRSTGRTLDCALAKDSFLAVGTPRGERYTRAGALEMAPDGALRTAHGQRVLDENGKPIVLDPTAGEPTLTSSGEVAQGGASVARVRTVTFDDPSRLAHEEASMLAATPASGAAKATEPDLSVGVLEESNASVTSAMTDIVTASRTFEAFQSALQTFGDMDRKLVTTVPGNGNG